MNGGQVVFDFKGDDSALNKTMSSVTKGLGGLASTLGKTVVAGATLATGALVGFAGKSIALASNLNEVQNVVDTTFGASSKIIDDFAKTAGDAYGISVLNAKQYNGTMGAMLKSMGLTEEKVTTMSTSLTGLSGDMASFYNLDSTTAFEKLRAGIAGETEPLKQLGINMSVANLEAYALATGVKKSYSEMTQAEQATLRYGYIMKATADAQGDFSKTSDSFANQQRILALRVDELSASFGSKLLPMANSAMGALLGGMKELTPAIDDTMNGFTGMLSGVAGASDQFASGFGAIIDKVVQGIAQMIPKVLDILVTLLPTVAKSVMKAIKSIVTGLIGMLPQIITGVVSIVTEIVNGLAELLPMIATALINSLPMLVSAIVGMLPTILNGFIQLVLAVVNGIATQLPTLIPMIVQGILGLIPVLMANLPAIINAGVNLLLGLIDGLIMAIPLLIDAIPTIIEAVITGLIGALPLLIASAPYIIFALIKGIISAIPSLVGMIPNIIIAIVRGLQKGIGAFADVGKNLIKGLWEGIINWKDWIVNKVKDVGKSILNGIKGIFGIKSPSKEMFKIGGYIDEGLINGINDMENDVSKAFNGVFDLSPQLYGTASQNLSPNVNVVVNSNYKQDALGQMVGDIKNFSGGAKNSYNYGGAQ